MSDPKLVGEDILDVPPDERIQNAVKGEHYDDYAPVVCSKQCIRESACAYEYEYEHVNPPWDDILDVPSNERIQNAVKGDHEDDYALWYVCSSVCERVKVCVCVCMSDPKLAGEGILDVPPNKRIQNAVKGKHEDDYALWYVCDAFGE